MPAVVHSCCLRRPAAALAIVFFFQCPPIFRILHGKCGGARLQAGSCWLGNASSCKSRAKTGKPTRDSKVSSARLSRSPQKICTYGRPYMRDTCAERGAPGEYVIPGQSSRESRRIREHQAQKPYYSTPHTGNVQKQRVSLMFYENHDFTSKRTSYYWAVFR